MAKRKPADRIGAKHDIVWFLTSAAEADTLAARQTSVEVRAGLEEYARECRRLAAMLQCPAGGGDADTPAS